MSAQPNDFRNQLIQQLKYRLFEESYPRLTKCLSELNTAQIWHRPNNNLVSVGNLVLHLCGNARQWILTGLCGQQDVRERQKEFDREEPLSNCELLKGMDFLRIDIEKAIEDISTEDLLKTYKIQDYFEENGISIIVHVIEHFSYHVGQITYYTKLIKDKDLGYYAELEL